MKERRNQVADELYQALVVSGTHSGSTFTRSSFRRITRHDMRESGASRLAATRGNYRTMLKLFGMLPRDYKRFLNFLAAHDCRADFREFRNGTADVRQRPRPVLPPLPSHRSERESLVAR